jgi:alkylhydroperoxidase family enzyme
MATMVRPPYCRRRDRSASEGSLRSDLALLTTHAECDMTWLSGLDGATADQVVARRPVAAQRGRELEAQLWAYGRLDPTIAELVRVRVAQLLGLPGARLDPAPDRPPREVAALGFAEQYVLDPSGISDAFAAELNTLFSEPELTALTFCVAVYDALGRVQVVLELDGALTT